MKDFSEFIELYKKISKFDGHMDWSLSLSNEGRPLYEFIVADKHLSSPGSCHGGALAAFLDAVLGLEALSVLVPKGLLCSTVEYKTNFLNPAFLGDHLGAKAEVAFEGNSLVVVSGHTYRLSDQKVIAMATGTFRPYPMEKKGLIPHEK